MLTSAHETGSHEGRRETIVALVVIGLVGLVVPILIGAHYRAIGVPRSDDWSYLVSEFRWVRTGRLSFNHWVSMSLAGQLALAAPIARILPRDIGALQVFVTALGTIGLGAVWVGARRAGISAAHALLLALTIALGPLWGPLALSFMTDVPAFAFSAIAVALAIVGVAHGMRAPWILGAVLAAFVACTIRQYAIVTLVAVVVAAWYAAGSDRRARRVVVETGVVAAIAFVVFLLWWRTVPDGRSLSPGLPDAHAVSVFLSKGAGFLRLTGLLLLPVLVAARPVARLRAAWREEPALSVVVAGATAVWLAAATARAAADIFVGNYVVHDGALSDIVIRGPRPDVLPGAAWAAVVVAATVAGVVLAVIAAHASARSLRAALASRRLAPDPVTALLAVSVVGYLGGYVAAVLTGIQVYDRYLLPVVPVAGMLLLRARLPVEAHGDAPSVRRSRVGTVVALVALAALGFAFATDSASFDGARFHAAEDAVARGWPVRRIAGGFEWRAYRRGDRYGAPGHLAHPCVAVKIDPRVPPDRIVAVVVSTAPTRRDMRLVAYRTKTNCPRPARAAPGVGGRGP